MCIRDRNYGSRDELTRAAQKMAKDCAEGKIKAEEIDESVFETYLDTHGIPDPDMMIRTSGEQRLSNYLLWQLAYSDVYKRQVSYFSGFSDCAPSQRAHSGLL